MSVGKHTPGPWAVEDPMGPDILSIVANGAAEVYEWKHIAQVNTEYDDGLDEGMRPGEAAANARLIAAAPLGLEIAQEFLAFAKSGAGFAYPPGSLQKLEDYIAAATVEVSAP